MRIEAFLAALTMACVSPAVADDGDVARAKRLFQEGVQLYDDGNLHEAIERFSAAYQIARSPALAFNMARVYERMGEVEPAIRYFRVYLKRGNPSQKERSDLCKRIRALREFQRRQESQVFVAPPSEGRLAEEARVFFERGVHMFKEKHYRAALEAFTTAHRFAPLPEILYNLAVTSEKLNQPRDAVDYYREYLRLRTSGPDRTMIEARIRALRQSSSR